ncbi:MAG: YfhO family protein [Bacteroidia bacterium]|nr:YfhO family protein [Bacteroidia bacterium]
MKKIKLSGYLVHIIAVLVFTAISYIYYSPVLEGKRLVTNDNNVYRASAREIIEYREKYKEEPLWTNSMFGGMPAYQISVKYKGNLVRPIMYFLQSFRVPVAALFLALLGFYILLIVYGVNPWLAIPGSIAFAFCSYNFIIVAAGHYTKAYAIAYVAPMLAGIILAMRKNRLAGAALAGICLAFELISNHLQVTYYALIIVIIYGISELVFAIKDRKIPDLMKSLGVLIIAVILAAGTNFTLLNTTKEYTKYTTRGGSNLSKDENTLGLDKAYATGWSIGINETLTLLIPGFMGGGSGIHFDRETDTYKTLQKYNATQLASVFSKYRGDQPSTSSVYAGAIVIFLFVLGLFLVEGREKWWLLAATVLSILLSWGRNFMPLTDLFLDYFPGYNKFRAVSTILVISGFTIPLMAALALRNVFQNTIEKKKFNRSLIWSAGITGAVCLLFTVLPRIGGSFISPVDNDIFTQLRITPDIQSTLESALTFDRQKMLQDDAFRSLIFIVLAAILLFTYYNKKIGMKLAAGILAVLFLADMWPVSKRFLNNDNFERITSKTEPYPMTAADKAILQDKSPEYRVLNLTVSPFNDASTSNYHKSIGGYHGAKLQIYSELIEYSLTGEINNFISAYQNNTDPEKLPATLEASMSNANSLNMLNTKYIIVHPDAIPFTNRNALGNAWFVGTVRFAENADEEISLLSSFNPSQEALIDKRFKEYLSKENYQSDPSARITLTSYKPNELKYSYSSASDALAVFSEIYYPAGWKSYIDGKEVPHFKADYVLRGLEVPAGDHEVIFRFEPESYRTGTRISFASSLLLILLCAGSLFMVVRKKITTIESDGTGE